MQTYSIPARVNRNSEHGLVWVEQLSGAMGTIEVPKYSAIRIRALGATTVALDGTLACTMMTNEIIIVNAGSGNNSDKKRTVTITIAGAAAYVQVGSEVERPREDIIA